MRGAPAQLGEFDQGDHPSFSFSLDRGGAPVDPDALVLEVWRGDAARGSTPTDSYLFDEAEQGTPAKPIVRDSEGRFHADLELSTPGRWVLRWDPQGGNEAVVQATLHVRKRGP